MARFFVPEADEDQPMTHVGPQARPRRATITDVAREAGTGKTSISRYLNGEMSVLSPELRERIEAAIAKPRLSSEPDGARAQARPQPARRHAARRPDESLHGRSAARRRSGVPRARPNAADLPCGERSRDGAALSATAHHVPRGRRDRERARREAKKLLQTVAQRRRFRSVLVDRSVDGLVTDMVGLDNPGGGANSARGICSTRVSTTCCSSCSRSTQVSSRRVREAAFRETIERSARARWQERRAWSHAGAESRGCRRRRAQPRRAGPRDRRGRPHARRRRHGQRRARRACSRPTRPSRCVSRLHLKARYGADWQARVALLSIDDPEWAELPASRRSASRPTRSATARSSSCTSASKAFRPPRATAFCRAN